MPTLYDALMNEASENPTALAFWRDRRLAPETDFMARRIAEELARPREPTEDDLAVWLSIPVREMYRAESQPGGDGVREHLRRLTGVYLSGGRGEAEWKAVLLCEWHLVEDGAVARLLIPPTAVRALCRPESLAELGIDEDRDELKGGRNMSVPRVDLMDPECEPSDAELEALMQSVCDGVIERDDRTQERFLAKLADSIARAAKGGVGASSGLQGRCSTPVRNSE